jgi:hypothetical protein
MIGLSAVRNDAELLHVLSRAVWSGLEVSAILVRLPLTYRPVAVEVVGVELLTIDAFHRHDQRNERSFGIGDHLRPGAILVRFKCG